MTPLVDRVLQCGVTSRRPRPTEPREQSRRARRSGERPCKRLRWVSMSSSSVTGSPLASGSTRSAPGALCGGRLRASRHRHHATLEALAARTLVPKVLAFRVERLGRPGAEAEGVGTIVVGVDESQGAASALPRAVAEGQLRSCSLRAVITGATSPMVGGVVSDRGTHEPTDDIVWMSELDVSTCWRLVEQQPVGRVAFIRGGRPVILPVNHATDDETVVFRTARHSPLDELAARQPVAFEVDVAAADRQTGWSVLVAGETERVDAPAKHQSAPRVRSRGRRGIGTSGSASSPRP